MSLGVGPEVQQVAPYAYPMLPVGLREVGVGGAQPLPFELREPGQVSLDGTQQIAEFNGGHNRSVHRRTLVPCCRVRQG